MLDWMNRHQRTVERIETKIDALGLKLDGIEKKIDAQTVLLEQIHDALVPEPAVTIKITAGPIEEQPN